MSQTVTEKVGHDGTATKPLLSEKGRACLAEMRAVLGTEPSGLLAEWRSMSEAERAFWLKASRISPRWATRDNFNEIPGDIRATVKNNLYRAARRAQMILQ